MQIQGQRKKKVNKTWIYLVNQMGFIEQNNEQDVLTHLWLQYRGCSWECWCSVSFVWWWTQFNHSIACKCEEEKEDILIFFLLHVVSNHYNFRKQKLKCASTRCICQSWCYLLRLLWMIKLVLLGRKNTFLFFFLKKTNSTNCNNNVKGKSFLFAGRNFIIIIRCGDLYSSFGYSINS